MHEKHNFRETTMLTESQLKEYSEDGYLIIPNAFSENDIQAMRSRLEDIVAGKFKKLGRRFQAEGDSGKYEDVSHTDMQYRGSGVTYRKVSDLEYDDVFLEKLQSGWIKAICSQLIGDIVSIMRVTMMDKPAQGGTPLPWHQDLSLDWPTSCAPELTFWFPLDNATNASGSLQVVPGSHKGGVIGRGHLLAKSLEAQYAPQEKIVGVEMSPGDCLVFHPGILHRSGTNQTDLPRRAINVILLPGHALHTSRQQPYPVLLGPGQLEPNVVAALNEIP
jgi:phytanoyl-CoA hydroxylase